MFPTAMVVKVKDAETKRNKASVAHTGWNKGKKISTTTPKKVCLYSSSLQLLFEQKICKSEIDRAAGKPGTQCDCAGCVKERGLMRSSPTVLQSSLSFLSCFFSLSFPSTPAYCSVDFFVASCHFSLLRSLLSLFSSCKKQLQATQIQTAFLVLSYALHLLSFRVGLASFTLTTMAVGNTNKGFASVLFPWSI